MTTSTVGLKNGHIGKNLTKNGGTQRCSWEHRRRRIEPRSAAHMADALSLGKLDSEDLEIHRLNAINCSLGFWALGKQCGLVYHFHCHTVTKYVQYSTPVCKHVHRWDNDGWRRREGGGDGEKERERERKGVVREGTHLCTFLCVSACIWVCMCMCVSVYVWVHMCMYTCVY